MFGGGPCPLLYIWGDRVTWKVLAEYSWSPSTARLGSFVCTAASSTPIWVVTREVRYIHELSLTLEQSMPIRSPAAPGLTPMISCLIYNCHFEQALCDLGASANIMPKTTFEKLSYPTLSPTMMCVQLADSTIQYPEGVHQ